MDTEKIKDFDGAILNLLTSAELWIAVGSIVFLFVVLYIKRVIDARSARLFGRQRFAAQSDIATGLVYWFGNAVGADPWVLISINNNYLKFEDKTRIRYIPTKSFPDVEWTISKVLSSDDVLSGSYDLKLADANVMPVMHALIEKLDVYKSDIKPLKLD